MRLDYTEILPAEELKFLRDLRQDYHVTLPFIPRLDYSHVVGDIFLHQNIDPQDESRPENSQGDPSLPISQEVPSLHTLREEMLLELMRLKIILRRRAILHPAELQQVLNGFVIYNRHIVGIGFCHLQIDRLPESIANLSQLRVITGINSGIHHLPQEIGNLSLLHTLELDSNPISSLPVEIGQLGSLQKLILTHNDLTQIPSLKNLSNLEFLDLRSNRITSLTSDFAKLQSLIELRLGYNNLTTIPSILKNLNQLQILDASHNRITCLFSNLSPFPFLKQLNLSENSIGPTIPSFEFCRDLEMLRLDSNQLEQFPPGLNMCRKLRELYLSNNHIHQIPEWIDQLRSLRNLQLDRNILTRVPASLCNLPLSDLNLANNQLDEVPENISNLQDLEFLNLSQNRFQDIPNELYYLPKRTEISIQGNNLALETDISDDSDSFSIHQYLTRRFEAYKSWDPTQILYKLEQNVDLDDIDRTHPDLGKYTAFFLEKLVKYNNNASDQLYSILNRRCLFPKGQYELLL